MRFVHLPLPPLAAGLAVAALSWTPFGAVPLLILLGVGAGVYLGLRRRVGRVTAAAGASGSLALVATVGAATTPACVGPAGQPEVCDVWQAWQIGASVLLTGLLVLAVVWWGRFVAVTVGRGVRWLTRRVAGGSTPPPAS